MSEFDPFHTGNPDDTLVSMLEVDQRDSEDIALIVSKKDSNKVQRHLHLLHVEELSEVRPDEFSPETTAS